LKSITLPGTTLLVIRYQFGETERESSQFTLSME